MEPELIDFTFEFLDDSRDSIVDSVQFTNLSTFSGSVTYTWNFGDSLNSTSTETDPVFVYGDTGVYYVSLTVEGDGVTDCPLFKEVKVIKREIPVIYPNVITPNGDGINDYFFIQKLFGYRLFIYNRWGKMVYENLYYEDDFNGEGLSDGMYYYDIVIPQERKSLERNVPAN